MQVSSLYAPHPLFHASTPRRDEDFFSLIIWVFRSALKCVRKMPDMKSWAETGSFQIARAVSTGPPYREPHVLGGGTEFKFSTSTAVDVTVISGVGRKIFAEKLKQRFESKSSRQVRELVHVVVHEEYKLVSEIKRVITYKIFELLIVLFHCTR